MSNVRITDVLIVLATILLHHVIRSNRCIIKTLTLQLWSPHSCGYPSLLGEKPRIKSVVLYLQSNRFLTNFFLIFKVIQTTPYCIGTRTTISLVNLVSR